MHHHCLSAGCIEDRRGRPSLLGRSLHGRQPVSRASRFVRALAPLVALSSAPVAAQVPPPTAALEFFNPTYVEHRSNATCAGAAATLRWRYAAAGVAVTGLTFQGAPASPAELARITAMLKGMPGDVLARIECGKEGALISFIDAAQAGTPARVVKISWHGGRAELVGRYRF